MRISDWSSDVCSSDLLAQPFEREKFALQRYEQRFGGDQRIERQHAERRRAVDQADVPLPRLGGSERLLQPMQPILIFDQLDHGTRQVDRRGDDIEPRSEEHTSELQSLMRLSSAVFCLNKNNN